MIVSVRSKLVKMIKDFVYGRGSTGKNTVNEWSGRIPAWGWGGWCGSSETFLVVSSGLSICELP